MVRETLLRSKEVPLSWFGKTLWKFAPFYLELTFLAICIRFLGLVEPFILQVIIDRVLPFEREATLIVVMAIFLAVTVFHIGFSILSSLLSLITANRVTRELGGRIFEHLFKLPFSYSRKWPIGEMMARISETDTIRKFLVDTTTGVFLDLLFVVIYLSVLYALSPTLMAIVLFSLPIQALVYFGFGPFLRRRLRVQFDTGSKHRSRMIEYVSGMATVKALSAEEEVLDNLDKSLGVNFEAEYQVGKINIASNNIVFAVNQALTILIIFVGALQVFADELTLGQLIAFHLVAEKIAGPVTGFAKLWESWQNIKISRQRLGDILAVDMEAFGTLPLLGKNLPAELRFEGVTFGYNNDLPILRDFSATVAPNSLTLIIGPSGIGKSTFGRLASGVETPMEGTILLGGADIAAHEPHDVRTKIAYVPQEAFLFMGTIRENMKIGNEAVADEEIWAALKIAAADVMVERLPNDLDTDVGERGAALSGGQRQRIAVARSLINNPKVLILDEPTSALDGTAQAQMVQEIERLRKHMTIIAITHRPDVFTGVDQIIDFESLT